LSSMAHFTSALLKAAVLVLGSFAVSDAFLAGNGLATTPALRSQRSAITTISMGRKGAQTGLGPSDVTRTVVRDKKKKEGGGVTVIKRKKITGVDVTRASIIKALNKATNESFKSDILNEKVEDFLKNEAGASMYPKLMKKIKSSAGKLGVDMPERWCYDDALATKRRRDTLANKIAEAENSANEDEAGAEEGEAAPVEA